MNNSHTTLSTKFVLGVDRLSNCLCLFILRSVQQLSCNAEGGDNQSKTQKILQVCEVKNRIGLLHQFLLISSYNSDSGCSKFLLKSAGPSHHQTSVSRHQKKAFGELYSTVMVGGCELKVYRSYAHFKFFPHKFQLNENTKVLGVC